MPKTHKSGNPANNDKSKKDIKPGKDSATKEPELEAEEKSPQETCDKPHPDAQPDDQSASGPATEDSSINDSAADEVATERDKYLRLAAEYDNFRKRSAKERETIFNDARADTISKLLPVYDNLERALKMECTDEAYFKGVEMTMTQLMEIFESMDVKPINAVGLPFDPNHHNAIMTIENPQLGEKTIAEEIQKGFMLGQRVIRFSTVVVAN